MSEKNSRQGAHWGQGLQSMTAAFRFVATGVLLMNGRVQVHKLTATNSIKRLRRKSAEQGTRHPGQDVVNRCENATTIVDPANTALEKTMVSKFNRIIILTAIFAACAITAIGQSTSATLSGIVSDPQGASIPNAKDVVTQISKQQTRTIVADAGGSYSIP